MSLDFHYNKRVLDDVAIVPSKRIRNKIAGYATKLMKRIQKGPVRGISLKLQEEERERRMETGAKENYFDAGKYKPDEETQKMLEELGLEKMSKWEVVKMTMFSLMIGELVAEIMTGDMFVYNLFFR